MGQTIFTCHFITMGERIYSTLWLRLDLKTHTLKKRQRKLFQKNKSFRHVIRPSVITAQKELLYKKYKAENFKNDIAVSLVDALLDRQKKNIYNTFECEIYDQEKLIAVSFFDLGANSISSIMGMYDPDYSDYSLGYYTMLLEIEYGRERGFEYYYPGYVTPGFSRFDYKLKIGEVEYFNLCNKQWELYQNLTSEDYPISILHQKLEHLKEALRQVDVHSEIYYYPFFDLALMAYWNNNYLNYPIFLWCKLPSNYNTFIIFSYNLNTNSYVVMQCSPESEIPVFLNPLHEAEGEDQAAFLDVLVVKTAISLKNSPERIAEVIMGWENFKHHPQL